MNASIAVSTIAAPSHNFRRTVRRLRRTGLPILSVEGGTKLMNQKAMVISISAFRILFAIPGAYTVLVAGCAE